MELVRSMGEARFASPRLTPLAPAILDLRRAAETARAAAAWTTAWTRPGAAKACGGRVVSPAVSPAVLRPLPPGVSLPDSLF